MRVDWAIALSGGEENRLTVAQDRTYQSLPDHTLWRKHSSASGQINFASTSIFKEAE